MTALVTTPDTAAPCRGERSEAPEPRSRRWWRLARAPRMAGTTANRHVVAGDAMTWISQVRALVAKDLIAEWRGRDLLASTGVFALLVLVVFTFAFDLRAENVALVAPGVLWVAFAFAANLGLGRSMATESERGTLEGLLLCPLHPSTVYVAKLISNLVFTAVLEAGILPVFAAFFDAPVFRPALFVVIALGTLGFVALGTLFAAMAAGTRAREILLPVLLFPVSVPVFIGAVKGTAAVLDGVHGGWASLVAASPWLNLLAGFDVLFLVICVLVFEYVVEQ